jgi:hypothetical protein
MSHEEMKGLLPAAALAALDPDEKELVSAHLRGCQECTQLLDEYREAAGGFALSLPLHPPHPDRSSRIRERLLTRARAGQRSTDTGRRGRGMRGSSRVLHATERWTGWMVAAGLAALLVNHHAIHQPLDYGWMVAGILAAALIVLGVYARHQRRRVSTLLERSDEPHPTD